MILLYLLLFIIVGTTLGLLIVTFNWRIFPAWSTATSNEIWRMGSFYRYTDTIEGPLNEDKTRPIVGYVCHVTFFQCDLKFLSQFVACYISEDGEHFTKRGYHLRGRCPLRSYDAS